MSCLGGCGFFGSPATAGYCSVCARKHGVATAGPPPRSTTTASGAGKESEVRHSLTLPTGQVVEVRHGDLTKEKLDAIVNAANSQLRHASGVAGAIVRNGGEIIQDVSDIYIAEHGDVPVGDCCVTEAGRLPCKYVIHAVGPTWFTGHQDEIPLLHKCIVNILKEAAKLGCADVSIPAISSGVFGFPKELCANIMLTAVANHFKEESSPSLHRVCFTNFDEETVKLFVDEAKAFDPSVARNLPEAPPLTEEQLRYMNMVGGGGNTAAMDASSVARESRVLRDGRVLENRCGEAASSELNVILAPNSYRDVLKATGGPELDSELLGAHGQSLALIRGCELLAKKVLLFDDFSHTITTEVANHESALVQAIVDAFKESFSMISMLGPSMTSLSVGPFLSNLATVPQSMQARCIVQAFVELLAMTPKSNIRLIRFASADPKMANEYGKAIQSVRDKTQAETGAGTSRPGESETARRERERAEAFARMNQQ